MFVLFKCHSSKQFGFRQSVFAPASPDKGAMGKRPRRTILRSYLVLGKAPKVERPEFTLVNEDRENLKVTQPKAKERRRIGEAGIRTLGRGVPFNGFQDRRFRPLSHLSHCVWQSTQGR